MLLIAKQIGLNKINLSSYKTKENMYKLCDACLEIGGMSDREDMSIELTTISVKLYHSILYAMIMSNEKCVFLGTISTWILT